MECTEEKVFSKIKKPEINCSYIRVIYIKTTNKETSTNSENAY